MTPSTAPEARTRLCARSRRRGRVEERRYGGCQQLARRGARAAARCDRATRWPSCCQLRLAHDIAAMSPTCRALDAAAKLIRSPVPSEVATLAGHTHRGGTWRRRPTARRATAPTACASAPSRRTPTGSTRWRWPGGARFVSVSFDETAKLCTFDGDRRTFELSRRARRCPTACTLWSVWATTGEVWLCHVDDDEKLSTPSREARWSRWRRRPTASTSSAARTTCSPRCGASPPRAS